MTQRSLAKKHGMALGLTNFLLRRLIRKGYVKIVNLQRNRLRYLITPKGVAEKTRLAYEYFEYSLHLYRYIRACLARVLSVIVESGGKDVIICGTGEVAELVFLILQQHGLCVRAVVDPSGNERARFMNQPVKSMAELSTASFDRIVVATLGDPQQMVHRLTQAGVPKEKLIVILNSELSAVPVEPSPAQDARACVAPVEVLL